MKNISQKKYDDFLERFTRFFEDEFSESSHPYYLISKHMLINNMNAYVNYLNFKEIYDFLCKEKNLKVVDVGAGIGDKACFIKEMFPTFEVSGFETTDYDDPFHISNQPAAFFQEVYGRIKKLSSVHLALYNGMNLPVRDGSIDVVLLYAVIEHIAPEKRLVFINNIGKKLKKGGYIIITRCPRYFGLMEFLSRKLKLQPHPWVLRKAELLNLFEKSNYRIEVFKIMNNVPNDFSFTKRIHRPLIVVDKILQFIKWPFATDYLLIVRKYD